MYMLTLCFPPWGPSNMNLKMQTHAVSTKTTWNMSRKKIFVHGIEAFEEHATDAQNNK